jgi:hypothetical protein
MALSGSLRLQTQDSAPSVGTNESVLYVLNDAGTKKLYWKNSDETQQQVGTGGAASGTFNEVNSGGTISLVTTASVSLAGAKGFSYGVNQVGVDTFFFVSGSLSGKGNSSGEVAVFGGHTVFSGALFGGVNSDLGRTLLRQEASQIAFSKEEGLTAGSVTGTDVFMFVSGAMGSKDTATRGTAVFGGDVVISGTLHGGSPLKVGDSLLVTGALHLAERVTAPNVPIDGAVLYARDDGGGTAKLYWKNGDNVEQEVGTGGGGGGGGDSFFSSTTNGSIFTSGSAAFRGLESSIDSPADKGSDVFFYVSGTSGGKGSALPSVTLFGGDIVASGTIYPGTDLGSNLGSPTNRFGNIYTGDLHLRNERGNWTIVEEEDYLCVVNNKTGKKFKMALIPLEE